MCVELTAVQLGCVELFLNVDLMLCVGCSVWTYIPTSFATAVLADLCSARIDVMKISESMVGTLSHSGRLHKPIAWGRVEGKWTSKRAIHSSQTGLSLTIFCLMSQSVWYIDRLDSWSECSPGI